MAGFTASVGIPDLLCRDVKGRLYAKEYEYTFLERNEALYLNLAP